MELGIFKKFWDGQPNHLPFLSLRSYADEPKEFNLNLSISKLEFILENNSEESIKESIKLILSHEDWRLHLIASMTLLTLRQTTRENLTPYFWERINKGSWVSPQIMVALSLTDIEFKEKSKKILSEGLKINYSDLPEIEHHVFRGGTPRNIAEKKIIASLDYLINDIVNDTHDNDAGGSICKSWKENLEQLILQNKFKLQQFLT
ncbi:hypothetical protein [Flavobacterium sp. LM4]|uniref:hypothetical protein n=1 Tax=Flavobacterium sp. LM4 TaxID=1938609 RepID=UPI0009922818|nr:hypothetical protein [Flavobacterium sp. LM4]OOV16119.1 hypothetical protein BXU10_21260 [Flavobacterium sp. LM4]